MHLNWFSHSHNDVVGGWKSELRNCLWCACSSCLLADSPPCEWNSGKLIRISFRGGAGVRVGGRTRTADRTLEREEEGCVGLKRCHCPFSQLSQPSMPPSFLLKSHRTPNVTRSSSCVRYCRAKPISQREVVLTRTSGHADIPNCQW